MTRFRQTLIAAAILLPGAALAADPKFQAPEGCTVYATVQQRTCQIRHLYRCDGDAPGDQWSVLIDGDGPFFASKIDAETRWLESLDLITGEVDRIDAETDAASFSDLLQTGRDDFAFTTVTDAGVVTQISGFDQLNGESVVIDGVRLERTVFELAAAAEDGSFLWKRTGNQFIHRDWRIFFSDTEDFENNFGDKVSTVDTPEEVAMTGDRGVLSMEPRDDCDVMTASYDPRQERALP